MLCIAELVEAQAVISAGRDGENEVPDMCLTGSISAMLAGDMYRHVSSSSVFLFFFNLVFPPISRHYLLIFLIPGFSPGLLFFKAIIALAL